MKEKFYISVHGGEGWESVTDDVADEIESIRIHWPKVPIDVLLENIMIFPLAARLHAKTFVKDEN